MKRTKLGKDRWDRDNDHMQESQANSYLTLYAKLNPKWNRERNKLMSYITVLKRDRMKMDGWIDR